MNKRQIGVIGLAVMGKNLALNIESKGFSVSVYERVLPETDRVLTENRGRRLFGTYSLEEFAASLETPRKIIMMIKAGQPVDDTLALLKPYLQKGDIVVDGGNSYFKDTIRRNRELAKEGVYFIGSGTSGGEEGALHGPALMPGGQKEAYAQMEPVLTAIAAKVGGDPCCAYIGGDGAGHFVKMVHNGIEYGDMQLICEAFSLLKESAGLSYGEIGDAFGEWNEGELDSYLIGITRDILRKKDPETSLPMLDVILDTAGQKGTGKWASESALDEGVSTQTITEAVFARCLSALKEERVAASKLLRGPAAPPLAGGGRAFAEDVRRALYASKICSYAQGFALLRAAAAEYRWELDYGRIAMIFRGGCIIRARFLQKIKDAYDREPALANLLLDPYFGGVLQQYQDAWRRVVARAVVCGVPVPALSSALAYFDGYRSERLPANLLQAQRDYFGAHTYERVDRPRGLFFHTDWTGHGGTTSATTYTV